VEETLHQSYSMTGLSDNVRNSIQNWTVMVDNEEMRDLFLADDWAAIQNALEPLPSVDDTVTCYLKRFEYVCMPGWITNADLSKNFRSLGFLLLVIV
jgi:hypothetical protein